MTQTFQLGSVGASKVILDDLYVVSDTATTSSSGSNNWTFMPKKANSTDLKSGVKTTNGAEISANTEYALGIDQNKDCAASATLQVVVTKNGTPTDLSGAVIVFGWRGRVDRG